VSPTFYSQLYPDLRTELSNASQTARTAATGIWATDATTSGATITTAADLDEKIVILPKLFRRLIDYLALGGGDPSLEGFTGFLATRGDRLFIFSEAHARDCTVFGSVALSVIAESADLSRYGVFVVRQLVGVVFSGLSGRVIDDVTEEGELIRVRVWGSITRIFSATCG